MDAPRIAALLEPFLDHPLTEAQVKQISTYIDLLLRWNARINLTAIRTAEEIVPRHFGESLFLARHLFPESVERTLLSAPPAEAIQPAKDKPEDLTTAHQPRITNNSACRVLDLGSGAGFPAIPLKIWAPQIHLTMIESNHKKAAFLREASRALTLTDINVIAERAEILSVPEDSPPNEGRRGLRADVVTFRAVEKFDQILSLAQTFLSGQGRLAILIGTAQIPTLGFVPHMRWQAIHIPQSSARVLAIGKQP